MLQNKKVMGMSRDDFDFINLTENLEKNTEELIKEVQNSRGRQERQDLDVLQTVRNTGGNAGQVGRSVGQNQHLQQGMRQNGQPAFEDNTQNRYELQNIAGMEKRPYSYEKREDERYGSHRFEEREDERYDSHQFEEQEDERHASYRFEEYEEENYRKQSRMNKKQEKQNKEEDRQKRRGKDKHKSASEHNRDVLHGKTSEEKNKNNSKRKGQKEEDTMAKRGRGKKKSSKSKKTLKGKVIKLVFILLILFGAVYGLAYSMVSKTNYEKLENEYERPSDVEKVRGVKNILLIGTDARSTEEDGRSDSMIIVSINDKNNRIVMTSVLRDSYVEIPGHGHNRINAAYSYGQEGLLIQTIEHNYKIPIDAYAKVDFFSFMDIVDSVGGVEIEITPEEMEWINAYLNETNELLGKEFGDGYLTQAGLVNLTGKQALSYARIRYIGTDFGRTERQRKILTAVLDKVKKNPGSVSGLMNSVLPNVTTDMKASELTMMTMQAVMYLGYDMEQFTLPTDNTWKNASINGMSVLQVDFEANIQAFKEMVYGDNTQTEDINTEQE